MPSFLLFVVLALAVFLVAQAVTVDCGKNSVSVRWINVNSQVDPSLLRLGDCPPTQLSVNPQGSEAVFYAEFLTCNIRRLVTTNEIIFETEITSPTLSKATPIYYPVACAYEREEDWAPPLYDPLLFHTHGQGDLAFRMALMKDDFSGVATTTTFSLGSMIPIAASVAQQNHQPLILLLDECLASTTPELAPDSHVYPLITNKGYVCRQDIAIVQKRQKERVIAFLRNRSVELERKVKEVRDQCYRWQVSELKQENEELKKPLSQRRTSPGRFSINGGTPRMILPVAVTSPGSKFRSLRQKLQLLD
ncbi:zona pellucida sperm-binding protein 3-like [Sinocyclocheilus rhinocerous]|uniref:zona pellucida sperm-binding protein 3-like n=1 Tax=Sinocyclocheilus rhinocerous TaxID=307959 RepID=UPI0007BA63B6|nr:PREDICTED: zona pellucida sperm-binding protein 3-like [Sinocyclocheilus rhinocerous]